MASVLLLQILRMNFSTVHIAIEVSVGLLTSLHESLVYPNHLCNTAGLNCTITIYVRSVMVPGMSSL